ncbi:DUF2142 domain-containing protein [Acidocella sp.]|uniref:DUF2142 domain-containing protein n=1 Tax=Acidocella sp. TaxID=50710 RepID=UPI00262E1326|nr:DUF2142 domain-containing protein [Acidocella sp.]
MALFFCCALPVTCLTALLTPPGQSPDEPAHLIRAAGLLHGQIIAHRVTGTDPYTGKPCQVTGVLVDQGLAQASFGADTPFDGHLVFSAANRQALLDQPPSHQLIFGEISNTAVYFPLTYLPATLGLGVANALGARPYFALISGRLCMAVAYVGLGLLAIYLAAYGEALLLAVLLLPMALFLAGTLNQDGVLLALTCLACALLTRETRRARLGGLAVLVVVLGSKQPYILLLATFLEPLFAKGWLRRLGEVVVAALPVTLWVVVLAALTLVPSLKQPYHPGPLFTGNPALLLDHTDAAANLHILLAQPSRFWTLPWVTNEMFGRDKIPQMIGMLGLLTIQMARPVYWLWAGALLCAAAGLLFTTRPAGLAGGRWRDGLFTLTLMFLTYWLLNIVFYLSWSNVGLNWIDGIQGRYLLPMVPFLLFAIPSLRRGPQLGPVLTALPAALLGMFGTIYVPWLLVKNFYLH